jgi:hypothetical protein
MSGSRPKIKTPPEPDPVATPIAGREEEEAKKKTRKRARGSGREGQILAGRMTAQSGGNNILSTSLG